MLDFFFLFPTSTGKPRARLHPKSRILVILAVFQGSFVALRFVDRMRQAAPRR